MIQYPKIQFCYSLVITLVLSQIGLPLFHLFSAQAQPSHKTSDYYSLEPVDLDDLDGFFLRLDRVRVHTPQGGLLLSNAMTAARQSENWVALESLAWYGHDEADNTSQKLRFLDAAADALSGSTRDDTISARTNGAFETAVTYRQMAIQKINRLLESDTLKLNDIENAHRIQFKMVKVAQSVQKREIANKWEEEDGDFTASISVDLQRRLSPGNMPDENYFRAAKNTVKNTGSLVEARRLLTKIDTLPVKRRSSSFHATIISSDIDKQMGGVTAFKFTRDWFLSHADEPYAGLLNYLIAYAVSVASSQDHQLIDETLDLLYALQEKYPVLIAQGDIKGKKIFSEQVGLARQLYNWENHVVSSQLLLSKIYLAEAIHDSSTLPLAREFIERYPKHSAVESVSEMINNAP